MNTLKIVILHLLLLATQALYMYLSNKDQLNRRRFLYVAAIPFVTVIPVLFNMQKPEAYLLYEYSIVFCIIIAAIADVSYSAVFNKDYLTDMKIRSCHYSYFLICAAVAYIEELHNLVKVVCVLLLLVVVFITNIGRRQTIGQYINAIILSFLSLMSAWLFMQVL